MHSFWTKGYEGTSLNDLESSMGLARTSIYNAYGNKQQLFDQTVDHYQQTILADLLALLDSGRTLQEGVRKFLDGVVDLHFRKDTPGGCLVVLSVLEREQHQASTISALEAVVQEMQKLLQSRIKSAQDRGELAKDLDARSVSITIVAAATGIMVMAKAGFSKASLRKVSSTIYGTLTAA